MNEGSFIRTMIMLKNRTWVWTYLMFNHQIIDKCLPSFKVGEHIILVWWTITYQTLLLCQQNNT